MKNENVVVKNTVILNLIQDLQRLSLHLVNSVRGRFQIKFGMTSLFNNSGFTLIELLVVVLIIGILAAVAVPQYQKAAEKAAAAEALPILDSMYKAAQSYYLANGDWPTKFDQLDVELPWTGTEKWRTGDIIKDTRSNDKWSLQIYHENKYPSLFYLGRISGKYAGSGFELFFKQNVFYCIEKTGAGYIFNGNPGDYCVKLFHAQTPPDTYENGRYYKMP